VLRNKGLFSLVLSILLLGGFFNVTTVSASYTVNKASKLVTTVKVTSVSLNKTKLNITVGGNYTLLATVNPIKAKDKTVKWTSSNPRIAKVDARGKVTAVSVGSATITATTVDGNKKSTCTVTISNPIIKVASVNLNKTTDSLVVGGKDTLIATINPIKATNKAVSWKSSNPTIATVDNAGRVVAISKGTATISVSTLEGNKTATCTVIVNDPVIKVTSVSLIKTTDVLRVEDKDTLLVTINPIKATNKAITWTSSDANIATVDNMGNITAVSAGIAIITVTTGDGSKTATCTININANNKRGYVYIDPETALNFNLKVRSTPNLNAAALGELFNYEKVEILDTIIDSNGNKWFEISYNNMDAYVHSAYIQLYSSPPSNVVNIARNITKQFEVGTSNQIVGNFDGQGLSLGYLQWCIKQGTLQSILNRMDRQYNAEMKSIFGTNYDIIHGMIHDELKNQLEWAISINDATKQIINPWYSQFVSLCNNEHFISIEADAEIYTVNQAISICDKYNLKTVRGFALAFDIAVQNGGIVTNATKIIDTALEKTPNMIEKDLLEVIANAVADSADKNSEDVRSRKLAIVNGQGNVHGSVLYLEELSDNYWR
jgi:uncharacterized protein YjdB